MYTYYVAHTHNKGVGSLEITFPRPITTAEQVREIQQIVLRSDPSVGWVLITNWILLSGPDTDSSGTGVDLARLRDLHTKVAAACEAADDIGDADPDEIIRGLQYALSMTRRALADLTTTATAG